MFKPPRQWTILNTRLFLCVILFAATLSFSCYSLVNKQQLGRMDGMCEEYFQLALNHHLTGSMYGNYAIDHQIHRPPGYIYFMIGVLKVTQVKSPQESNVHSAEEAIKYTADVRRLISLSQAVLLALSGALLFLWLCELVTTQNAFIFAALFGLNPYSIILTGLTHYAILHIFAVILTGYVLTLSLKSRFPLTIALVAGLLAGISTLIRPMTLILPAFVVLIYIINRQTIHSKVWKMTAIFCLGMMLIISPYAARNFILTKKIIPVNVQGGSALWAATVKRPPVSPNHYNWWEFWHDQGMPIYQRLFNKQSIDNETYFNNMVILDEELKKEAVINLRKDPSVFMKNFMISFGTFNGSINSVFIKFFQALQTNKDLNIKKHLKLTDPQDFYSSKTTIAFELFIYTLQFLSLLALLWAIRKKNAVFMVGAMFYLCFLFAHCITYLDLMYYYIKLPFLFIFSACFVNSLNQFNIKLRFMEKRTAIPINGIINCILILYCVGLNLAVFTS